MILDLDNKKALVTASTDGIGLAIARSLVEENVRVILASRSKEKLAKVKSEIGEGIIDTYQVDLNNKDSVINMCNSILFDHSGVDILVYNVGGPPAGYYRDFDDKDWDNSYSMIINNYRKAVDILFKNMIENQWGRIISISSISGKQPIKDLILSNVFRPALSALNKSLSDQYSKFNLTFNTICPGAINTRRIENIILARTRENGTSKSTEMDNYINQIPMHRLGSPNDVASLACFLASEKAGFISGTSISVDGGITRGLY